MRKSIIPSGISDTFPIREIGSAVQIAFSESRPDALSMSINPAVAWLLFGKFIN